MKNVNFKFYASLIIGVLLWFFFFLITPIEAKNSASITLVLFILLSYFGLLVGFSLPVDFSGKFKLVITKVHYKPLKLFKILISLIIISFFFRYFDLFYIRGLSIHNSSTVNKVIASNDDNYSFVFGLFSMFRVLYFVPLIYYFYLKFDEKKILFFCFCVFFLPLLEGYLRDSRRIIFEVFILLFLILIFNKKINFNSLKTYLTIFVVFIVLLSHSFSVVEKRTNLNPDIFYESIVKSPYNDFVPLKKSTLKFIEKNKKSFFTKVYFSEIHIGQYITHGVFEMDYMISGLEKHKYGMFNSYLFIKFLNKLKVTNVDLDTLNNPTGRNTYITFFGGLYYDFGWFGPLLMIFYGFLQKQVFLLGKKNFLISPIVILLFFSNCFLLVMNFTRAHFLLTYGVYFIFLVIAFFFLKKKYKLS